MPHLWLRAESRADEARSGLTPEGAADLIAQGLRITVEESGQRVIPVGGYRDAGAEIVGEGTWPDAPTDAIILGLKELPESDAPLGHRHVMFGHAYKGQGDGRRLLARFAAGGGTLLDLEYLTDDNGRRVAAFGYWAGFAGAAVSLMAHAAQARGDTCPPVTTHACADALVAAVADALAGATPDTLIIGALGRVGRGAADMLARVGIDATHWDKDETASGGPFPEVLDHAIFLNCILASSGCPVFVPETAGEAPRALRVIGDIACDPGSDFSPIRVYDRPTTWADPVIRVHKDPALDVMAIDNLPAMLPMEASEDFAGQLLPHLKTLGEPGDVWARAEEMFRRHAPR